jgi:hypothetical protein
MMLFDQYFSLFSMSQWVMLFIVLFVGLVVMYGIRYYREVFTWLGLMKFF